MLNPRRERIQDDLRGLVEGDVYANTVFTQAYAADASIYEVHPLCVVLPRTTMDIVSTIRYARKNGLSVHPRGAGSSCVGAPLGEGIVLDLSRYMRRLLVYNPDANILHVQAGMQCSRLNDLVRAHNRQLMPGAGNSWPNTIGGLISMDGYGARWLSSGRPSDWLLEVEIVTANGNIMTFTSTDTVPEASECPMDDIPDHEIPDDAISGHEIPGYEEHEEVFNLEKLVEPEPFLTPEEEHSRILASVANLVTEYNKTFSEHSTKRCIHKMGYRTDIKSKNTLNMARLIAGSEGSLGVITAVKLRLPELPPVRKTLLLLFKSMEKAMKAVPLLLPFHPEACELIDRRYLHLAAERDVRFDTMFPPETEAALLIDFSDTTKFSMLNRIRNLFELLIHQKELAFQMISSVDEVESNFFWELAGTFEPSVLHGFGKAVRITIVEDAAVSPTLLYDFFLKIQELLRKYQMTAAFYAHAVQGQVRLQPLADLHSSGDAARLLRFVREYYALVHSMGGSIGTENGLGMGWRFWTPLFENEKYDFTCAVKRIFDPYTLLQPGKMGTEIPREPQPEDVPEMFWRQTFRPAEPFPKEETFDENREERSKDGEKTNVSESVLNSNTAKVSDVKPAAEQSENVLDSVKNETKTQEEHENESGILIMERVREILGSALDVFEPFPNDPSGTEKTSDEETENGGLGSLTQLGLEWNAAQIQKIANRCNGCGKCRGTDLLRRTCPMFRHFGGELSSPRSKVNLMEGLLNETLELPEIGDEAFHAVMHLCFQCHSCRLECPAGVDVPFLVRRAEEAWARARGLNFYDSALVRVEPWVKRFHRFPRVANLLFSNRSFRWFLEKTFGVARGRHIPHFETRSFLEQLRRSPGICSANPFGENLNENPVFYETPTGIQGRVVYFLDLYANHFETSIARSTIQVFQHNHIPILVPQRQEGSGLTAVMLGRKDFVQKQVYRNAALLADYVRQGYDIIVTEPSAALAFRWEYPQSFPENEDVALVSKHCFDAGEYLYKLHVMQLLKMPTHEIKLNVAYHAPCRLRALNVGLPFVHLMGLIPGLEVVQSPHGCCGMGGTFGMMAANYSAGLKMGRPLQMWFRNPMLQIGATECSSCKIQLSHNSTKPVLHPIKILAKSYGIE